MKTIAILNEKGGTAKTTTSVNLAASLGEMGQRVLLVDLDGQAASTRWLGVEGDTRLADALLAGTGLNPIQDVLPGVSLAPACGKLDSISHNLRPTQGSQLRRVLAELDGQYDYVLIDCPPSLGNRLIGNALLAATHAIVPVETSILALDGLRILLTMLDDIRQGFEHEIELIGALGCRFNSRTRLSRLVLAELHRALPGKVFGTVVRETVRMQECPATSKSILDYAPDCSAAADYRAVASELVNGIVPCEIEFGFDDLADIDEVDMTDRQKVVAFRKRAGEMFCKTPHLAEMSDDPDPAPIESTTQQPEDQQAPIEPGSVESEPVEPAPVEPSIEPEESIQAEERQDADQQPETPRETPRAARSISVKLTPSTQEQDVGQQIPVQSSAPSPREPARSASMSSFDTMCTEDDVEDSPKSRNSRPNRDNVMVGAAAMVLLGVLSIGGWVGFKALTPAPQTASARPAPMARINEPITPQSPATPPARPAPALPVRPAQAEIKPTSSNDSTKPVHRSIVITADSEPEDQPKTESKPNPADAKPDIPPTGDTTPVSVTEPNSVEPPADEPKRTKKPTTQPATKAPTTQPAPRVAKAEDYPSGLTLTGVMYGKTSRRAIISGTVVFEGDKVKDAKVVKILPDSVEIEANGFRFVLGTGPKPVWLKATQMPEPKPEPKADPQE